MSYNYRDDIREKLVVVDYPVIIRQFLTLDTSSAFAINENILDLFMNSDSSSSEYNFADVYYEIEEKLRE